MYFYFESNQIMGKQDFQVYKTVILFRNYLECDKLQLAIPHLVDVHFHSVDQRY